MRAFLLCVVFLSVCSFSVFSSVFITQVAVRFIGSIKMVLCVFVLREKKLPADLQLHQLVSESYDDV